MCEKLEYELEDVLNLCSLWESHEARVVVRLTKWFRLSCS